MTFHGIGKTKSSKRSTWKSKQTLSRTNTAAQAVSGRAELEQRRVQIPEMLLISAN